MAAPTSAAAPAPPAAAPAARSRRLLLLLIGVALAVAVAASGAAVWLLLSRGKHPPAPPERELHVIRVGTLIVNVAETNGRRYLRTTLELGAVSAKAVKALEERRTPILDTAITVLGATPLEQLLDHERRETLKTTLRDRLNQTLEGQPVAEVFFTEFVIQ